MLYCKMYKQKDFLPGKTVYNANVKKEFIDEKATRRHCCFSIFFMSFVAIHYCKAVLIIQNKHRV